MTNKKLRVALLVVLLVVSLLSYGGALALYGSTVVEWFLPWAIALFLALLSGLTMWRLWRPMTEHDGFLPNYLLHVAASTGIWALMVLGVNRLGADEAEAYTEQVTVERKYREEHRRTRRVGRNRYSASGATYYDYHADLRLPDGRFKSVTIPLSRYNRLRTGSTHPITLAPGLLGWPVICSSL